MGFFDWLDDTHSDFKAWVRVVFFLVVPLLAVMLSAIIGLTTLFTNHPILFPIFIGGIVLAALIYAILPDRDW